MTYKTVTPGSPIRAIKVLRNILRSVIASYAIGWGVLAWNLDELLNEPMVIWVILVWMTTFTTLYLAVTLSVRALVWWITTSLSIVIVRIVHNIASDNHPPIGIWFITLSGLFVTMLAVISINALTIKVNERAE